LQELSVTITIGAASAHWPDHPHTVSSLFQAADRQLYAAKQAGRNCVRIES
jgi:GGDEF domain-containing protein